jgi:hypothetical protein
MPDEEPALGALSSVRSVWPTLKSKRATIAAEIVQSERQLRHRKESLVHVDATLRLLDPSISLDSIPNKRLLPKRVMPFRQGELGRLILGALRQVEETPLSTREIASAILAAGGHGESARPTVAPRVRGNLCYLERRGKVIKTTRLLIQDSAWPSVGEDEPIHPQSRVETAECWLQGAGGKTDSDGNARDRPQHRQQDQPGWVYSGVLY